RKRDALDDAQRDKTSFPPEPGSKRKRLLGQAKDADPASPMTGSIGKGDPSDDTQRDKTPSPPKRVEIAEVAPSPMSADEPTVPTSEGSGAQDATVAQIESVQNVPLPEIVQSPPQELEPQPGQQRSLGDVQETAENTETASLGDAEAVATVNTNEEPARTANTDAANAAEATALTASPSLAERLPDEVPPLTTGSRSSESRKRASPASKWKQKQGLRRLQPHGGSVAAQRKKIFMDIVEKCGGVYPGIPEMQLPFKAEWDKLGHPGRIEKSTLVGLARDLCNSGRIRLVTFVIKDAKGLIVKKSCITKVEIDPQDPKVRRIKSEVQRFHPLLYTPEDIQVPDKVRQSLWNRAGLTKQRVPADLEEEKEDRVRIEKRTRKLNDFDQRLAKRADREAKAEKREAIRAAIQENDGVLPPEMDTDEGRSILGNMNKPGSRRRFAALFKQSLPNPRKPRQRKIDRLTDRYKARNAKALAPLRPLQPKSYLLDAEKNLQDLEQRQDIGRQWIVENTDEYPAKQARREALSRQRRGADALEAAETDVPEPSIPRDTQRPKTKKKRYPERHAAEARQQLYTLMDPEHFFHPATGTYSINFSRYRTVNQIMGRYHWRRPADRSFHEQVDDSEMLELNAKNFQQMKFNGWPFINHTFLHQQKISSEPVAFRRASVYNTPDVVSGRRRAASIRKSRSQEARIDGSSRQRYAISSSQRGAPSPETADPATESELAKSSKTRQLTTVNRTTRSGKSQASRRTVGNQAISDEHRVLQSRKRETPLTPEESQRILVSVTVVRTLAGGVGRLFDWVLISKAYGPERNQSWVSEKWARVLQNYKVQAQQLETNFQQLFLKAYENGTIPPIDYDDLISYDWAWLVDYTIENIDVPLDEPLDLPLQRGELDELFGLSTAEDPNLSSFFEIDSGSTIRKREADLNKTAYVLPIQPHKPSIHDPDGKDSQTAITCKSWIRANVATKIETYNPKRTRERFSRNFDPKTIDQCVQQMLADKTLTHMNKGRLVPGRNYDLHDQYLKPLRKKIEAASFEKALLAKKHFDATLLKDGGEIILPSMADDGFMIAVQNLQAHGRVELRAKNPPMKKWGLGDDGSYKTRLIDKKKLKPTPAAPTSPTSRTLIRNRSRNRFATKDPGVVRYQRRAYPRVMDASAGGNDVGAGYETGCFG
ncbi:MAG: hypothetical protein Q9183_004211, partial [Haloplaca sp. 2 TL-2023]